MKLAGRSGREMSWIEIAYYTACALVIASWIMKSIEFNRTARRKFGKNEWPQPGFHQDFGDEKLDKLKKKYNLYIFFCIFLLFSLTILFGYIEAYVEFG